MLSLHFRTQSMLDEAIAYVEVHALSDDEIRKLAVRVMINVQEAWNKYQDEITAGNENANMIQEESLNANLANNPLDKE